MRLVKYVNRESQAESLANIVAEQIRAAIGQNGVARIALSGGTTPQAFLAELDKQNLPWESVRLTLTDERQVAADNPRSNLRFICSHLPQACARAQLVPLYDAVDRCMDVDALNRVVREQMLPLDVCVLGMGEDGHFASLFPTADNLDVALAAHNTTPVMLIQAAGIAEGRVSLTLSALLSAPAMHLLIQGESKRQVLNAASAGASALPVAALLAQAGDRLLVHFAD